MENTVVVVVFFFSKMDLVERFLFQKAMGKLQEATVR